MKHEEGAETNRGQHATHDMSSVVAAAHELKSPLVLMRQLAIAATDEHLTPTERQRLLDQLRIVSERGLRLTTDITRTARLEASLFVVEPVNALQLCESVVRQITPLYQQYNRKIHLNINRRRPVVLAHRDLLASVLYHFADNALHYGDDNSTVSVSLQARPRDGQVRIGVRDKGPSLSLKEWRRLKTTPHGSLVTRPQGSGLGLHISEQFSRAMGGATGLTRHRDGVTFYVDLPVSEQLQLL